MSYQTTPVPGSAQPTERAATERQVGYIRDLLNNRQMDEKDGRSPAQRRTDALAKLDEGISMRQASAIIEYLKSCPKALPSLDHAAMPRQRGISQSPANPLPDVPAGRYAVEHEGVLKFYRVDRPDEGRWAGYTFLAVQASDDLHPIKGFDRKREILTLIATDPAGASKRYGQEIGECGVCGRTLTDETSREYGIGPICRDKTGW